MLSLVVPYRFNSQPPEGGWVTTSTDKFASIGFQLTAARRRLGNRPRLYSAIADFNSQPREGGWMHHQTQTPQLAHFNSQPREGGWLSVRGAKALAKISTHSRAKAAGSGHAALG